MTLEQKNELKLYKMTIQNRLRTVDQYLHEKPAIEDLESIKAKTDYMLAKMKGEIRHD
jgi:hypothetical protein|tara:strand:- start:322 stop:495 length:174 start_codon:yes stop_codon:yes gene_type:complete